MNNASAIENNSSIRHPGRPSTGRGKLIWVKHEYVPLVEHYYRSMQKIANNASRDALQDIICKTVDKGEQQCN